jgi:hypothetical protein
MAPGDPTPEADALEQREDADGATESGPDAPDVGDDRPEADTIEQSQVVEDEQILDRAERRDDVPEADWLDQSIAEPLDEER